MARIIPYASIQFTAHEQWRKILKVDQDKEYQIYLKFLTSLLCILIAAPKVDDL